MKIKNLFILAASALTLSVLPISCASAPGSEPFYDNNIGDFSSARLSNGIEITYKINSYGKIPVVRLLFEGGVPLIPSEKSGLEQITLDLMLHGSKNYSYESLQQLTYEKQFQINGSSGKDYSSMGFVCIQRDFNLVTEVLADALLNPLFLEKDFTQEMTDAKSSVHRMTSDPERLLGLKVADTLYKGHQYWSRTYPTAESVEKITLEDVKNHHQELLNASRIKIVVVGNFTSDQQKAITELFEEKFGQIPAKDYQRPVISEIQIDDQPVYVENKLAGDIGYIQGFFKCPDRTSPEYIPFAIAEMFLDEILFSEVREKNSALYSIGTGIAGGRKRVGSISLYKASEKENLKKIVYDAVASFPKTEDEINEKLDGYKNKYITILFNSSQSSSGIAGSVGASIIYNDSPTQYLHRSAEVQAVTAKQVLEVYKKYFNWSDSENPNPVKWIILSGKDSVRDFKF